ncbi:thermonuclease family protein [Azospirillum doebereinerae]
MRRRFCLLLFCLFLPAAAPVERWRVVAVPDGDTLELEDGRRVRLAGIEAAKPPRNADPGDGRRWPLAEAATAALAELALGRVVTPRGEAGPDRHGRPMAQLTREDGVWLQAEMLARGHARVHTRPDARGFAREMLAAEETARAQGRGLWRTRVYAVRGTDPAALARDRDSFQIVEGRVLRVSKTGGEAYLDFGEDWRTDTTVHIPRAVMRDFGKAGIDPLSYEGRRIRVRGWIGLRSGPMIDITHPEQIERLEGGPTAASATPPPRSASPAPEAGPDDEDESE